MNGVLLSNELSEVLHSRLLSTTSIEVFITHEVIYRNDERFGLLSVNYIQVIVSLKEITTSDFKDIKRSEVQRRDNGKVRAICKRPWSSFELQNRESRYLLFDRNMEPRWSSHFRLFNLQIKRERRRISRSQESFYISI